MKQKNQSNWAAIVLALGSGTLFALGLVLSGMTQPAKVLGFLNVLGLSKGISWTGEPGYWDPSLAFVMGGALIVTLMAFGWVQSKKQTHAKPWYSDGFHLPNRNDIDRPLMVGAVLFGLGWGLLGYCPGPALASALIGGRDVILFTLAMLLGMWATKKYVNQTT